MIASLRHRRERGSCVHVAEVGSIMMRLSERPRIQSQNVVVSVLAPVPRMMQAMLLGPEEPTLVDPS